VDLEKPLVSVNDLVGESLMGDAKGVLGNLQGQSLAKQKAIVEEASKGANDLTGLVKRKRKDEDAEAETASNGKRAKTEE
jgi:HAT1-interacting factor 1